VSLPEVLTLILVPLSALLMILRLIEITAQDEAYTRFMEELHRRQASDDDPESDQ
jgi:hypothetical protein